MIVSDSSGPDGIFRNPRSWPPGFRFHPTEEEVILFYLKKKICRRRIQFNVIAETDVYKWDPEELPEQSVLKNEERQWFFFSPRDRKYPNGARTNRATRQGYWKATGKDRDITSNSRCVGNKKTLVFYRGRAPRGQRTNWVMHEYTMDEEELRRCPNAKDHYALYKLYKKSGAGPKNGEQYGAPFREEDWTDDGEYVDPERPKGENVVPELNASGSSLGDSLVNQGEPPSDDLDELLKQLMDEPEMKEPHGIGLAPAMPKVPVEVEPESPIMGSSFGGAMSSEPSTALCTWERQWDEQTSFNATQSVASYLPFTEPPEVTSAPNNYEQATYGTEEVGFLEVNDLCPEKQGDLDQQTGLSTLTKASDISSFGEIDELNGPDEFYEAQMFLREVVNQYIGFPGDDASGQLDYQPPIQVENADEIPSELWVHDQRPNIFESAQSNLVVVDQPQSDSINVIDPSSSTNIHSEQMLNRGGNVGGDSDSWLSSYVYTLLGSIPTRPALASENALINRAFERMSSFGRVRIVPVETGVAAGEDHAAVGRRASRNKWFVLISLLGLVFAILWMLLIGTIMKVLKTFVGRLTSS